MPLTAKATCTEIWHSICDKAATAVKKKGSHTKQLTPKLPTREETAARSPQVTMSKEPQTVRKPDSSRESSTGAGLPEARPPTEEKTDRGAKSFTTAGHSQEREPSKRRLQQQHGPQTKRSLEPHKGKKCKGDKAPQKQSFKNEGTVVDIALS